MIFQCLLLSCPLQEFPEDSWAQRLLLFQETIALRFGFIACAMENRGTSPQANRVNRADKEQTRHHHQYVHITGNMFLLIPSPPCHRTHAQDMNSQGKSRRTIGRQPTVEYPTHHDMVSSPHEEYITRHVCGNNSQDEYGPDRKARTLFFLFACTFALNPCHKRDLFPFFVDWISLVLESYAYSAMERAKQCHRR